jgi:hypothetical protein
MLTKVTTTRRNVCNTAVISTGHCTVVLQGVKKDDLFINEEKVKGVQGVTIEILNLKLPCFKEAKKRKRSRK